MTDLRVRFPKPCDAAWEAMAPVGCGRRCAQCETVVHDLSRYDVDQVEALLRTGTPVCVRARIDPAGVVALKPSRRAGMRRMVVALGASAGLLASGPALAGQERPKGSITGKVEIYGFGMKVRTSDASGKSFRAKVRADGRYTIKKLPPGTYTLTFTPDCGESWTIENVVVGEAEVTLPTSVDKGGCNVVGMLELGDSLG